MDFFDQLADELFLQGAVGFGGATPALPTVREVRPTVHFDVGMKRLMDDAKLVEVMLPRGIPIGTFAKTTQHVRCFYPSTRFQLMNK